MSQIEPEVIKAAFAAKKGKTKKTVNQIAGMLGMAPVTYHGHGRKGTLPQDPTTRRKFLRWLGLREEVSVDEVAPKATRRRKASNRSKTDILTLIKILAQCGIKSLDPEEFQFLQVVLKEHQLEPNQVVVEQLLFSYRKGKGRKK